jgi:DNA-binding YbaB/EbfC family protein
MERNMSKGKKPRNPINRAAGRPMGGAPSMGGGMGNLMSQMQKLQEEMAKTQAQLETEEITVSVGGGMVTVVATGDRKLKSVTIKREVVDPDDIEMLQDLILSAVNDVMGRIEELQEERLGGLTGGLNLPPGLGF